jgi:sensor histidine kinase YesM
MRIRSHYLIKKRMQLGLTLRFLFLIVVFSLFIGFEVYITIWPVVSGVIPKGLMNLVWHQIFFRLLCFSVPVFFVITAFSVIFSHRIAGPLYRLEQTLDKIIQGDHAESIQLRKGDELEELAEKINKLIHILRKPEMLQEKIDPSKD